MQAVSVRNVRGPAPTDWKPRGSRPRTPSAGGPRLDANTVRSEQHLYLQQPAYGTSYIIGKIQIEDLLAARRRQLGDAFTIKRFMDELNAIGLIPAALVPREMTGEKPAASDPVKLQITGAEVVSERSAWQRVGGFEPVQLPSLGQKGVDVLKARSRTEWRQLHTPTRSRRGLAAGWSKTFARLPFEEPQVLIQ